MPKLFFSLGATVLALSLGACAVRTVPLGATRAEVIATYGTPSSIVALPAGTRLQYSMQPNGQSAVMVDLDAANRVISAREVLNPAGFAQVVIGQWTEQDAEAALGRPASIDHVASWPGTIMTYRWLDADQPMLYFLYLDANKLVQRTGQAMETPIRANDN